MKKALVIFLTLAMAFGAFADEPVADVKVADFKGDASLTFGVDLTTDKGRVLTGFKNETSASLKLNLFNGGSKSTTGDGIWGELVLEAKNGGSLANTGTKDTADFKDFVVTVKKAQVNFGPVYMGILKGDFNYGGDYFFPNALNYQDKKDMFVTLESGQLGYTQGFVLGYKNDMITVQGALRSKGSSTGDIATITKVVVIKGNDAITAGENQYYTDFNLTTAVPKGTKLTEGQQYYKVTRKGGSNWTNKYAIGLNTEIKPIKDLRIGLGAGYALGDVGGDKKAIKDDDNRGDAVVFAGFDYRFNINDTYFIQPVLAYNLYVDATWDNKDEKLVYNLTNGGNLGFGLRFGWSGSADENSLLQDFFGDKLYYNTSSINKSKDNDKKLLPGVSLFTGVHFNEFNMKNFVPLLLTFYSGDTLVPGLKAYALFGANVGPDAAKIPSAASAPIMVTASQTMYDAYVGDKGLQVGAGAGYDIKVDEVTLTPAAAILWTSGTQKGTFANVSYKGVAHRFNFGVKFDVKGLVDNTTFSVKWAGNEYGNMKGNAGTVETSYEKVDNGELTFTVKIAL